MATYVNDLRLKEIATGDESGTWGTSTNTNLELIAEAFSYGTEAITTNADTHTTTIADGSTDPGRSIYLKYTGTLDSACTITIGPNTVSKLWFIENATSGSQNIILSQGSGANITIPAGDTKVVYSDGAGSGAAFFDAFASLNVGALTATSLDISGDIDVDGTTNLDVVDIDGAVNMATTALVTGVLTTTAATVFNGGFASNAASTISTADNLDTLSLISTDADANVAPNLRMYRNSSSPADADQLGKIQLEGRNDNSQDVIYAEIGSQIKDASDGSEDGRIFMNSIVGGTLASRVDMTEGETIFNNDSLDLDFRVESDGNTHAIFMDAATNTVSFGSSNPITAYSFIGAGGIYIGNGNQPSGDFMSIDAEGGSGSTSMIFYRYDSSAAQYQNRLSIAGETAETVFNDSGLDVNFRVESDGNANMLFVDAGSNEVGIGTNDPRSPLHVQTSHTSTDVTAANTNSTLSIGNSGSGDGVYNSIKFSGNQQDMYIMSINDGQQADRRIGFFVGSVAGDAVTDERLSIMGDGAVVIKPSTITTALRLQGRSSDNNFFVQWNNNDGSTNYGSIGSVSATPGLQYSADDHKFTNQATNSSFAQMNSSGAVFNEDSANRDFRVESDNLTHAFVVDGAEGKTGIGANATGARLSVFEASNSIIAAYLQNGDATINNSSASILYLQATGDTAIQDGYKMVQFADSNTVLGSISTAATSTNVAYNTSSDERLKENIVDAGSQLDTLLAVKVREYDWKKNGFHSTGFIAQELHKHIPEAVTVGLEDETKDPWSVDYGRLTPFIIKAMQEQQELIKTLEARITALES